jgi:hypothetical protein
MMGKVMGLPKKVASRAARMLPRISQAMSAAVRKWSPKNGVKDDEDAGEDAAADAVRGIGQAAEAVRDVERGAPPAAARPEGLAHDPEVAFRRASLEHRPLPFPSGSPSEVEMTPDRRHVAVRLEREHHGVQMLGIAQVHVYN